MGFLHAKCEQCWDPLPCSCDLQRERDAAVRSNIEYAARKLATETNELLREQNRLIAEQNALLRKGDK